MIGKWNFLLIRIWHDCIIFLFSQGCLKIAWASLTSFIPEGLLQQYLQDRFGLDEHRQKQRLLQTKQVEPDAITIRESETLHHHVTYWKRPELLLFFGGVAVRGGVAIIPFMADS